MNSTGMWDVPYCFPYVALAARYKNDAFIRRLINKWLPEARITTHFNHSQLDFTYVIEHDGSLLIAFLGTEGDFNEAGWKSNFSPQIETSAFKKMGGHVDFIKAGEETAKIFAPLVDKYKERTLLCGHSRGGARCIAAARWFFRETGVIPERVVSYCGPPVFTSDAADEYDKSGLGAVTVRPIMHHDIVHLLGTPILKHVGVELKLPHVETIAIRQRGIKGKLVYGHAYSSIFECWINFCNNRGLFKEKKWLEDTQWVATV